MLKALVDVDMAEVCRGAGCIDVLVVGVWVIREAVDAFTDVVTSTELVTIDVMASVDVRSVDVVS